MKIKFLKDYEQFATGNICEMFDGYASSLVGQGIAEEYTGINIEIMPEKETPKEVVYVPIMVNEQELFEQIGEEEEVNNEVYQPIVEDKKFKSKLK
jgi:hypothetical protein